LGIGLIDTRGAGYHLRHYCSAAGAGSMASRSISSILAKSPNQGVIPWHRIVYAGGKVWLSPESEAKRRKLYKREGIEVDQHGHITNFDDAFFDFSEL